ncbi:hypothetical protein L0668_10530 [Paraglaciecola aquimarina]|uniref:DUF4915 domain-containing protein n=1 Tax=Paraglaciecola algarum TaxID=3050085 RepID=A0ABS9D6I6_9ALTE|nr:hypothetical protein [Paraglaciecola sp. G1-23]MCF2948543.1 hypothetical protein [Paraglaciecola sp. G1-23]
MDVTEFHIVEEVSELVIKETVSQKRKLNSVYWLQGEFYLKGQKRIATVTDVKYLSDTLLVVAHRAAAKLYLVKQVQNKFIIIDSLILDTTKYKWNLKDIWRGKRFFHPDLITLVDNRVYMSEYSNRSCMVEVIDNKLVYRETLNIGDCFYHGCFSENKILYLGSVYSNGLTVYNTETGAVSVMPIELEKFHRIKTIGKEAQYFVLGTDKQIGSTTEPEATLETRINLYCFEAGKLNLVDWLELPSTQVDGHKFYDGYHYYSLHNGNKQKGYIGIFKINDKKLKLVKKISCQDFPHGVDIKNNKLIYSCYSQSSIISIDVSQFDLP